MVDKHENPPDQLAFSIQKAQWLCWTALNHETCEISAGVLALPGFGKAGTIAQNSPYQYFGAASPSASKTQEPQAIINANTQKQKSENLRI